MNLYIDLGNTRMKWATGNKPEELIMGETIDNALLTSEKLKELWQTLGIPEKIAVAKVGDQRYHQIITTTAGWLWPDSEIISVQSQAKAFGIENAYAQPETLGVDRWLGMVAAFKKLGQAFCLVSCGTAITIDMVDQNGRHLGGLISPGLRLMREALVNNTANLNMYTSAAPFGLANNTETAITNGTLAAACGLIETSLKNHGANIPLILTGGDAEIIAQTLSRPAIIEPNLVLAGLALTIAG